MTVFAFGPRWPSELVKDAVWVKVPVGRSCVCCTAVVREDDQGLFVGYHDQAVNVAEPVHVECYELAKVTGRAPNVDLACVSGPPAEVLLAALDHTLRNSTAFIDAEVALNELCKKLNVDRAKLKYDRGWAKKYLT